MATEAFVTSNKSGGVAAYSKGQNGWLKFDNGIMIQWGKIYPNPSAGWTTHSFNTAFPTACSNLVVTQNTTDRGAQSDSTVNISAYNMTRTNFSIRAAYSEAREGISWIAFGY